MFYWNWPYNLTSLENCSLIQIPIYIDSLLKSRPCGFGQSLGRPIVWSISHFFWSTRKNLFSLREFLVSLWIFFGQALIFWYTKKKFWYTKKKFGWPKQSEPDQKFPETEQIFFCRPKKGRNRLDNWSTKRLTKTTWTGLLSPVNCKEVTKISHKNSNTKFVQKRRRRISVLRSSARPASRCWA